MTLTARNRWVVVAGLGLLIALSLYYYGAFAVDFFPQTSARGD